ASLIVSSLLCYPLDTVRRHLMMEAGQSKKLYKNQFECWKGILYNEGPRALYKGALTNSLRCTSGALILAVYYECSFRLISTTTTQHHDEDARMSIEFSPFSDLSYDEESNGEDD
uniref:ADP/ATP translocase n=1 Tax=Meloidogyne floridensis TaxID=298350 RepID=A0A915NKJ5_9BILA